jgi:dCMP deaminase
MTDNLKYREVVEYYDGTGSSAPLLRRDFAMAPGSPLTRRHEILASCEYSDPGMFKQVKFDTAFLRIAEIWAQNSHAKRKKVGCIIVRDYNIISDGYNGMPSGFDNTCEDKYGETKWEVLHAEANAIVKLAKSSQSSTGATLYITFSPCKHCAKMIMQAGIARVVYTEQHSDVDGLALLARTGVEISRYFLRTTLHAIKNI